MYSYATNSREWCGAATRPIAWELPILKRRRDILRDTGDFRNGYKAYNGFIGTRKGDFEDFTPRGNYKGWNPASEEDEGPPRFGKCKGPLWIAWNFLWKFMETSTIHGFNHLAVRHRSPFEYVFWIIIMILAGLGAINIGLTTWERYQENPTVLSIDKNTFNFKTAMPAVLLCPEKNMNSDVEKEAKAATNENQGEEGKRYIDFVKGLFNASYLTFNVFTNMSDFRDIKPPSEYQSFVYTNVEKAKTMKKHNVLFSNTDVPKYKPVAVMTELGACFSVLGDATQYMQPRFWENGTGVQKVHPFEGYRTHGHLTLQVMQMATTLRFYLSGYDEVPEASTLQHVVKHMHFSTIYISPLDIMTTDPVKRLSVKQRGCRLPHESNLLLGPRYSYGFCRMECRMKYAQQLCGCVPFFYKKIEGYEICDPVGMSCLARYKDELVLLKHRSGEKLECKCLQQCDTKAFKRGRYSTMKWSIGAGLKIQILAFPDMKVVRELSFGVTDVLVSIGGTAGFFLGCSFLSLIEVVYFFTLRLFWYLVRKEYQMI